MSVGVCDTDADGASNLRVDACVMCLLVARTGVAVAGMMCLIVVQTGVAGAGMMYLIVVQTGVAGAGMMYLIVARTGVAVAGMMCLIVVRSGVAGAEMICLIVVQTGVAVVGITTGLFLCGMVCLTVGADDDTICALEVQTVEMGDGVGKFVVELRVDVHDGCFGVVGMGTARLLLLMVVVDVWNFSCFLGRFDIVASGCLDGEDLLGDLNVFDDGEGEKCIRLTAVALSLVWVS